MLRRSASLLRSGLIVAAIAAIGFVSIRFSQAATYAVSGEVEGGAVAGKAYATTASGASNGSAVKFGSTAPAPAGTLWWSDTPASPVGKSAPLQNWEDSSWNLVDGTMKVVADNTKGKAVQFYLANGNANNKQRVEGTIPYDPVIGRTQYIGFDLYVNGGGANGVNGWQCIMQLKSNNEGNPSFELELDAGKLYAMSNRLNKPNQKVLLGNAPVNKWTRMVLKMYVTTGTDSKLAAWQDGTQTLQDLSWESHDNTGENNGSGGLIYSNAGGGYYKFGIYRGANNNFALDVRYANMKIGSTYDIVAQ